MTIWNIFKTGVIKRNKINKEASVKIMILENQEKFLIYWIENLHSLLQPDTLTKIGEDQLKDQAKSLFKVFMMILENRESLHENIHKISIFHADQGITLTETAQFVLSLRDSLFKYLYKEADDISSQQTGSDIIKINQITDQMLMAAVEAYSGASEQEFLKQLNRMRQDIAYSLEFIPKVIQRLDMVKKKTEEETLNVISALQNIVQRSKEGSEEADAVVAYFMGNNEKKDTCFGKSYISYMIHENETAMEKAGSAFQMIEKINNELSNNLKIISDKVEKIQDFVRQIDKIASQSKILSVNSAIEAARAGEKGLRFAVVADEIRNLADMSARSVSCVRDIAEESKEAIDVLQKNINEHLFRGAKEMEKAEKTLKETFERFKYSINNISEAIRVLTISYQAISKEIENATVALQFQDMISQEIVSINSFISSFNKRFEKIYQDKETEVNWKRG